MSSTGISILGKNGSSLEAIASTSNALKIDIASNSAGALSVSDSTSQASLATIAGDTTSLDTKFSQGYDAQIASGGSGLVQIGLYGRDNSGNWDAVNVENNGDIKVSLDDIDSVKGQNTMANSLPVAIASDQSTLNVSDSTAQSSLSSINSTLSSTLSVSDSTAQSSLSSINSALGGTLTVSDSTAQSTLSSIQTAVELMDDIVLTDGNAYSASSSKGVMLLAKDNSGNFKPVELNASSELKVTSGAAASVSATATTTHSSAVVSNGATDTSSAVDLNGVSEVEVLGNVTEYGAEIEILVSSDDVTYYKKTDISLFSDYNNGDFAKVMKVHARYLKVKYNNDSGSSHTISSIVSRKA